MAADLGYGMAGPGGRGTGTPYAGLSQSGMGYRALRYGWRWTVDQRFNVGVARARQDSLGGTFDHLGNGVAGFGRTARRRTRCRCAAASHSDRAAAAVRSTVTEAISGQRRRRADNHRPLRRQKSAGSRPQAAHHAGSAVVPGAGVDCKSQPDYYGRLGLEVRNLLDEPGSGRLSATAAARSLSHDASHADDALSCRVRPARRSS